MNRAARHNQSTRRSMLASASAMVAAVAGLQISDTLLAGPQSRSNGLESAVGSDMSFGLVTYQWGKDMDLPTLIETCEKSGLTGVELRTEHRHAVEPALSKAQRDTVRKRFETSSIELIGYGSNAQFHEGDADKVKANIKLTKQYIQLMHDCGGSGVKVKPNGFVKDVPHEQTIEQIGRALNEVAEYGQQYGQQIRVEVHGAETCELPVIKAIFDVATHPNVAVCWNSNAEDLKGEGLDHNFNLVKDRFGATVHVRELTLGDYPYDELFRLFKGIKYAGWILLEARAEPADKVAALIEQRLAFEKLASR